MMSKEMKGQRRSRTRHFTSLKIFMILKFIVPRTYYFHSRTKHYGFEIKFTDLFQVFQNKS